ncbi:hypothetical protein C8T65DRAFT_695359 [Cerioporus squamosus]|nr:hypothetical protein C8T65DRAFT_695359 [Cerioporus squamosus]
MSASSANELLGSPPSVYTFARWDRQQSPPSDCIARPRDLKYYLRVANCGNGLTIPLPMRAPEERILTHLRAIIAFMETYECSQLNLPLRVWRLARDFALTFHAFWTDERTEITSTRQEISALLIHTTPYKRLSPIPNATDELLDIMAYAKTCLPWDIYSGRYLSERARLLAGDTILGDMRFRSRGVTTDITSGGNVVEEGEHDNATGNALARALGFGRPPTGTLSVWMYVRVNPKGVGDGDRFSKEDLVYFVRINKLPRRINIPLYVHGFDAEAGHTLQTLHALLHEAYVAEMGLPPALYNTVHKLILMMLSAWSQYPGFPATRYQEMMAEMVARTPHRNVSQPADHGDVLREIVGKAASAWTGVNANQLVCLRPSDGEVAEALREYIRGRVMTERGIQVGDNATHERGRTWWELPDPQDPMPRPLCGVFGSLVDVLDDPREDLRGIVV